MKIICLTGGIGSGKSTVAEFLYKKGFPVYNSDTRAKELMNSSEILKAKIIDLLGVESYQDNQLNKRFVGEKIFKNHTLLKQLNAVVHPEVKKDFTNWIEQQKKNRFKYCIKESALLFESNTFNVCDSIILITASEEIRIQRIIKRDKISREQVMERIKSQLPESQKSGLSDYVIYNEGDLFSLERDLDNVLQQIACL